MLSYSFILTLLFSTSIFSKKNPRVISSKSISKM